MNEINTADPAVLATLSEVERQSLFAGVISGLLTRHSDAMQKITEFENHAHNLRMELQRTQEAVDFQRRRKSALERRVVSTREAVRSWEDEQSGIFL